eukprot:scaffold424_cov165-Ochromonas_danica.AAC.9
MEKNVEEEEVKQVDQQRLARILRGAGGGGHGGGGVHHHHSSSSSSSSQSCTTKYHNVTSGNSTSMEAYQSCHDHASPFLAFITFLPLFIILFCAVKYCGIRRRSANAQNKAQACECLHHTLQEMTADGMTATGHQEYYQGWICDKCNHAYRQVDRNIPFYRCPICCIDLCVSCKTSRPSPTLMHQMSFNYGHGFAAKPVWQTATAVPLAATQVVPTTAGAYEMAGYPVQATPQASSIPEGKVYMMTDPSHQPSYPVSYSMASTAYQPIQTTEHQMLFNSNPSY